MNKRLYQSRFQATQSDVLKNRSTTDIPFRHKTTANFGKLVPFYIAEIVPGDTFDVETTMLARMSTPLYPVMDNAYIDYYYFFVPNRLVWSNWAAFLGENKMSSWAPDVEYIVPHAAVTATEGGLLDHCGIPIKIRLDIDFLVQRAYKLIWNEWFRDQNTTDPVLVNTGDDVTEDEIATANDLLPVTKYFDYFTSALPAPQKGDAVDIPLGDYATLTTLENDVGSASYNPLRFYMRYGDDNPADAAGSYVTQPMYAFYNPGALSASVFTSGEDAITPPVEITLSNPSNLVADLSSVSGVTINALRQAFQMQRLLELQARTGSRYVEIIKASFGVTSPDARMQRPEYLGGKRIDVQMQQVTQTSSTDAESPLGHVGAYSKTISANRDFKQSFTEHGFVIGLMCARTNHTYQQGLHKMWTRRGRFDFYWPTFAHIGEQPIKLREIYAQGTAEDDEPFGYQEAWAEYRFMPNLVTGAFRSAATANLDEWTYADFYSERPYLSSGWIAETSVNVDRTLAVTSELSDQLIFDIFVFNNATRVMPLYSVPGLIDHF